MFRRLLAVLTLVALPHMAASATQQVDLPVVEDIATKNHLPGLSVAVLADGKITTSVIGAADVDGKRPVTPGTVYRIGSITKPFTAVAVMQLAERHKIDLDAPIQRYCPAFPDKGATITSRMLLSHQGGIRDYDYRNFDKEYLNKLHYSSIGEALHIFEASPLVSAPGTEFHYSAWGYVLLGCAIEGASKEAYRDYIRRHILRPAGMNDSGFEGDEKLKTLSAIPYDREGDAGFKPSPVVDVSDRWPAGGIVSTPGDLMKFAKALFGGRLLKPASLNAMWTEQMTKSGEPTGYGLGWRVSKDRTEVYHGGTSVGGSSYLLLKPNGHEAAALAANLSLWTNGREEAARRLLAN